MTLDYIETLTQSVSLEALWDRHTSRMAEFGFDRLIYGYTSFRTNQSLGEAEDFIILSNHDQSYLDRFLGDGLYFDAPMMPWTLNNSGACSWSWVQDRADKGLLSAGEKEVLRVNEEMGVTAGYTISFPSMSSRVKGAMSLVAAPGVSQKEVDEIWEANGRTIELINQVAHLKIMSLPYDYSPRSLTSRQREVLEWVGEGKSVQDIALLISRTPATVEKHLRLARAALNVQTTAQALLKASFLRQIYRLDQG
ncbi:LuxR family transcriptional regulator [uncultured Shimia sp.]|uniref:LuxR family transcriptional regulator n=1 Tax=uncultured Shimia sp. TaxID=573152 RepID=UPI00262907F9|nr:LuxR family transcriptional regulator [uncultured Shimia sp.]